MDPHIAAKVTEELLAAVQKLAKDYIDGDIGDEDDFSSQLIGLLKGKVESLSIDGTFWSSTTLTEEADGPPNPSIRLRGRRLTSRGRGSEEKEFGADIVLVLDIDLPMEKVTKGMLIQAKVVDESGDLSSNAERNRLIGQCEAMLDITPSSYVVTYSKAGVRSYSATAVESSQAVDLGKLATYEIKWLFHDFLICWVGDPRIKATDKASLAAVRALVNARNAMLISATEMRPGAFGEGKRMLDL